LPVTFAYLISFAIYGFWISKPATMADKTGYHGSFDISFFPYLVPLGLALLIVSIHKHKDGFTYMASPFLAPYVGVNSYTVVLLGLCKLWSQHQNALPKEEERKDDKYKLLAKKISDDQSEPI